MNRNFDYKYLAYEPDGDPLDVNGFIWPVRRRGGATPLQLNVVQLEQYCSDDPRYVKIKEQVIAAAQLQKRAAERSKNWIKVVEIGEVRETPARELPDGVFYVQERSGRQLVELFNAPVPALALAPVIGGLAQALIDLDVQSDRGHGAIGLRTVVIRDRSRKNGPGLPDEATAFSQVALCEPDDVALCEPALAPGPPGQDLPAIANVIIRMVYGAAQGSVPQIPNQPDERWLELQEGKWWHDLAGRLLRSPPSSDISILREVVARIASQKAATQLPMELGEISLAEFDRLFVTPADRPRFEEMLGNLLSQRARVWANLDSCRRLLGTQDPLLALAPDAVRGSFAAASRRFQSFDEVMAIASDAHADTADALEHVIETLTPPQDDQRSITDRFNFTGFRNSEWYLAKSAPAARLSATDLADFAETLQYFAEPRRFITRLGLIDLPEGRVEFIRSQESLVKRGDEELAGIVREMEQTLEVCFRMLGVSDAILRATNRAVRQEFSRLVAFVTAEAAIQAAISLHQAAVTVLREVASFLGGISKHSVAQINAQAFDLDTFAKSSWYQARVSSHSQLTLDDLRQWVTELQRFPVRLQSPPQAAGTEPLESPKDAQPGDGRQGQGLQEEPIEAPRPSVSDSTPIAITAVALEQAKETVENKTDPAFPPKPSDTLLAEQAQGLSGDSTPHETWRKRALYASAGLVLVVSVVAFVRWWPPAPPIPPIPIPEPPTPIPPPPGGGGANPGTTPKAEPPARPGTIVPDEPSKPTVPVPPTVSAVSWSESSSIVDVVDRLLGKAPGPGNAKDASPSWSVSDKQAAKSNLTDLLKSTTTITINDKIAIIRLSNDSNYKGYVDPGSATRARNDIHSIVQAELQKAISSGAIFATEEPKSPLLPTLQKLLDVEDPDGIRWKGHIDALIKFVNPNPVADPNLLLDPFADPSKLRSAIEGLALSQTWKVALTGFVPGPDAFKTGAPSVAVSTELGKFLGKSVPTSELPNTISVSREASLDGAPREVKFYFKLLPKRPQQPENEYTYLSTRECTVEDVLAINPPIQLKAPVQPTLVVWSEGVPKLITGYEGRSGEVGLPRLYNIGPGMLECITSNNETRAIATGGVELPRQLIRRAWDWTTPFQNVSANQADTIAKAAGCRLPTSIEWLSSIPKDSNSTQNNLSKALSTYVQRIIDTTEDGVIRKALEITTEDGVIREALETTIASKLPPNMFAIKSLPGTSWGNLYINSKNSKVDGGAGSLPWMRSLSVRDDGTKFSPDMQESEWMDLTGNLSEFVTADSKYRVAGGSFLTLPGDASTKVSDYDLSPDEPFADVGFRLAFDIKFVPGTPPEPFTRDQFIAKIKDASWNLGGASGTSDAEPRVDPATR